MSQRAYDVLIVGAGFSGMYMLHKTRELGLTARIIEAGSGVGGTWYWNRYPGARCDVESVQYQYGFSEELQRGWSWTERYAAQPEILRYMNYVADRLDLRRDIQFETRVNSAIYDENANRWSIMTDKGENISAKYCVMATGCLSSSRVPDIAGLETFQGNWYHTAKWPHEGVDFTGRRVSVIGTGSSGIQSIPLIAEQASELFVFQRTPNFSLPASNHPLDPAFVEKEKAEFGRKRDMARNHPSGHALEINKTKTFDVSPAEQVAAYAKQWTEGGFAYLFTFADVISSWETNAVAAKFAREKIREKLKDEALAELLIPQDHAIGCKRLCLDTGYYETFNKPHVHLVDVRANPIERITSKGVVSGSTEYEVEDIVFATGFDAMTGAVLNIDIRGRNGLALIDKWASGPRTYLGLSTSGFPNLFFITGPGSPSVLTNMIVSIEQHVEWVSDCIANMEKQGVAAIEADESFENGWVDYVNELAHMTLHPQTDSWYMGANIPGKPRIFMPFVGGLDRYKRRCDAVAAKNYDGFNLTAQ